MLLEDLSNCIDAKSNCHAYMLNILDKLKQVCISNPQHQMMRQANSHQEPFAVLPLGALSLIQHSLWAVHNVDVAGKADAPTVFELSSEK